MRAVELSKVAAAAEVLRLGRFARRQAIRAGIGVGALLFTLAAFGMVNRLAYDVLILFVSRWLAALIVFAVDVVVAGVLVTLAVKSTPDAIEREAVTIRRQALAQLEPTLTTISSVGKTASLAFTVSKALRSGRLSAR